MIIDEKINSVIDAHNKDAARPEDRIPPVSTWEWHGTPGAFSEKAKYPQKIEELAFFVICEGNPQDVAASQSVYVWNAYKWYKDRQTIFGRLGPDRVAAQADAMAYVMNMVGQKFLWDQKRISLWLQTPRDDWYGQTVMSLIAEGCSEQVALWLRQRSNPEGDS